MLVADIGGTNARFGLVNYDSSILHTENEAVEELKIYQCKDYDSFEAVLDAYISSLKVPVPETASIAIAGPVTSDNVCITNCRWEFSIDAVRQRFGFKCLDVINDFVALACAVPELPASDLEEIKPGSESPKGTKLVLGPGTGLGVAALVHTAGTWLPIPSEAGHSTFSPQNKKESEIFRLLSQQYPHVFNELLISGPGLERLYRLLAEINVVEIEAVSSSDIVNKALEGDPLCAETLSTFCEMLGAFAADCALHYCATGGVYLGGGILPRIKEFFKSTHFNQRFILPGVMAEMLEETPIQLITHPYPGLIGAASWSRYQIRLNQ